MVYLKTMLERALLLVISVLLTGMVCLMLWQVFTRYVLATPAIYTEETLRFTMIWMALLGTAYCFGAQRHLSLEFMMHMTSGWMQKGLAVLNGLISIVFAGLVMLLGGWGATTQAMSQLSPIMQVPIGCVYLAVPVSAVLIIALVATNLFLILTGRMSPIYTPEETG